MKTSVSLKKSAYSAIVFFGALGVLHIGYATLAGGLSTADRVVTGSGLSATSWNRIVDGVLDLEGRLSNFSFSSGKVGIGTASPTEKLTVVGNLKTTGYSYSSSPFAVFDQSTTIFSGTPVYLGEWNKALIANGGNNSAHGQACLVGVFEGTFAVQFEASYSWGWAGMFVAGMSDFIDGRIPKRQITPAAQINNYYGGLNNNSNNMVYKSVVEGGVSTEATLRSGGFASGTFEIGRNSSNQIYLKDPAATVYVLGTYSGPVKTCATIQAPAWVRVLSVT